MAREIERKFLVAGTSWKDGAAAGTRFRQGYLSTVPARTVRVRLEGDRGVLTIKGLTVGVSRLEFEYAIPAADAAAMLDHLCLTPLIEKTRYRVVSGADLWSIDEFHGANAGLLVAEIELRDTTQAFVRPEWLGVEVSDDPRYFNANLVTHPFTTWTPSGAR
jgi:CYTH domain-containing protein